MLIDYYLAYEMISRFSMHKKVIISVRYSIFFRPPTAGLSIISRICRYPISHSIKFIDVCICIGLRKIRLFRFCSLSTSDELILHLNPS